MLKLCPIILFKNSNNNKLNVLRVIRMTHIKRKKIYSEFNILEPKKMYMIYHLLGYYEINQTKKYISIFSNIVCLF